MPVIIENRLAPPAGGVPGDIDTLFVPAHIETAGLPLDSAVRVRSVSDYVAAGGDRADNALVYDGLDNFFREGGRQAYVGRYTTAGGLESALALFPEDLGGGQVVAWDETPGATLQGDLDDWAAANSRFALHDVAVGDDTTAELVSRGTVPTPNNDYGAVFGPWVTIPAPSDLIGGTARQVPATSTVAALIARSDALGNPNSAPAGRDFTLWYGTGTVGPAVMSDADAASLRAVGVNPIRKHLGLWVLDGFRTTRDNNPDDPFWQANPARARMWLQWQAKIVGLNYEYKTIDGRGHLQARFKTDLEAVCKRLWDANGLYGDTPNEAFTVTTDATVNPEGGIAAGEMVGVVEARFSLAAETVKIQLVSVPITGRVSSAA